MLTAYVLVEKQNPGQASNNVACKLILIFQTILSNL